MKKDNRKRARESLDSRLAALKPEDRFRAPPKGWIRAVRDAHNETRSSRNEKQKSRNTYRKLYARRAKNPRHLEREVTDLFQEPDDATPLTAEEREGLLQTWITNRHDLNEAEEENILKATAWARRQKNLASVLNDEFAKSLHKRMFGEVWQWAGAYRQTGKTIGIDAYRIPVETVSLFNDAHYGVKNKTYPPDETAIRLHHRLVAIHPFPNGNGRHARLMADLVIQLQGKEPYSWGRGKLADVGALRTQYISALRAADDHNIQPLLAFARS